MMQRKERRKETGNVHEYHVGRESVVGIATDYGLDGTEIKTRRGRDMPHKSRPAVGPHSLLHNGYQFCSPGVKWPRCGFDHPHHLAPSIKKEYSYTYTRFWVSLPCSRKKFMFRLTHIHTECV